MNVVDGIIVRAGGPYNSLPDLNLSAKERALRLETGPITAQWNALTATGANHWFKWDIRTQKEMTTHRKSLRFVVDASIVDPELLQIVKNIDQHQHGGPGTIGRSRPFMGNDSTTKPSFGWKFQLHHRNVADELRSQ